MTPEEVAGNWGEFYSLVHDRSDIKEGSFPLFPAEDDRFRVVVEGAPSISSTTNTRKRLSGDGRRLDVKTETTYRLSSMTLATTTVSVLMDIAPMPKGWSYHWVRWSYDGSDVRSAFHMSSFDSLEIEVPVALRFRGQSTDELEEGLGQALSALDSGPHVWELKASDLNDWLWLKGSVQLRLLQKFAAEGRVIYEDLYSQRLLRSEYFVELDDKGRERTNKEDRHFDKIRQDLSAETTVMLGDLRTWISEYPDLSDLGFSISTPLTVERIDDIKIKTQDR